MKIFALFICSIVIAFSRALECSSDESLVQRLDYPIVSNGCSKPSFLQVDGEEDFTYCCDRHDACYETCGMSKNTCETEFEKCMKNLCSKLFSHNPNCPQAASVYMMGTTMFGGAGFTQSQDEYCSCVPKDNTKSHWINYLDSFYHSNVPQNQQKSGLSLMETHKFAKNSGTEESPSYKLMPKLVYELHKKYDNAIKHVDQRIGKSPPNPSQIKQKSQEL